MFRFSVPKRLPFYACIAAALAAMAEVTTELFHPSVERGVRMKPLPANQRHEHLEVPGPSDPVPKALMEQHPSAVRQLPPRAQYPWAAVLHHAYSPRAHHPIPPSPMAVLLEVGAA
jgi:hypothetical protein